MIVTALYAALLSVLLTVLILRVARLRLKLRIGVGDGGNAELQRAIRVHGNFTETAPWALIMMMVMETTQALPETGLHVFGAALFLSRGFHAWGLTHQAGLSFGRSGGILVTMALFLIGAAACLWRYFN